MTKVQSFVRPFHPATKLSAQKQEGPAFGATLGGVPNAGPWWARGRGYVYRAGFLQDLLWGLMPRGLRAPSATTIRP
jgi:hypothetical protein